MQAALRHLSENAATYGVVLNALLFAAALGTAFFAGWQLDKIKDANTIGAYLTLRDRFHTEKMRRAIACLVDFRKKFVLGKNCDAGRAFLHPTNLSEDERKTLKAAVRLVSCFFEDVAFLLKERLIDPDAAQLIIDVPGLNVYYEICVPILVAQDRFAVTMSFASELQRVLACHGIGIDDYVGTWADFEAALPASNYDTRINGFLDHYYVKAKRP